MTDDAPIPGVYRIANTVTGRVYVGFGVDVLTRMTWHIRRLEIGQHFCPSLQADWDALGAHSFDFSLVEEVAGDLAAQTEAEERWIALAMASPSGAYNRHRSCKSRAHISRKRYGKEDQPSFYPAIGTEIRVARVRAGINQRELGRRLGISHAAVSDLETGKTKPDLDNLAVVAEVLGVPLTQLVVLDTERRRAGGTGDA